MSVSSWVLSNWDRRKGKAEVCLLCGCIIIVWLMGKIVLSRTHFTKIRLLYNLFTQTELTSLTLMFAWKAIISPLSTASYHITVITIFLWCQSTLQKVIWKDFKPRAFCLRDCRKTDGRIFERSLRGFQGLNPFFLSGWRLVEEPAPVGFWCNQTWLWSSLCVVEAAGQKGA